VKTEARIALSWIKLPKKLGLFFALFFLLAIITPESNAHGYIVRSIPEDRVTLERPPTRLQYWFSEDLEPTFSEIKLREQGGEIIAEGGVDEANQALLSLRVPPDLPDGAYIVELRPAFASDGHVVAESRVFFVGEEIGGVTGSAASDQAIPLEVVWRVLVIGSFVLLFGVYILYSVVLVPAWGNSKYPAGRLPPRIMQRLNRLVWIALLLGFAGNILALLQQTMIFFGVGMLEAVTGGLWQVVRIGSRFGDVWNARMIFLLILLAVHFASIYYREKNPRTVHPFWSANSWVAALLLGSLSVNSHAAGAYTWAWMALIVDWLHGLGVAVWIGGVAALTLVLPIALKPYEGSERQQALVTVMRRFSRLIVGMMVLVIGTGIYQSANWFYAPADFQTTYGAAWGLKLLMVLLLLGIGALHHLALNPMITVQLERLFTSWLPIMLRNRSNRIFYQLIERAGAFAGSMRLETIFAVVTLILAGLLSATPLPEPTLLLTEIETPTTTETVNGLEVTQSIIPGGPGVNTYDTVVRRDGQQVDDVQVAVQLVSPERDQRGDFHIAEAVDTGLFVAAGAEIEQAGIWWSLVDVTDTEGETTRVVYEWDISEDATVLLSLDPSLTNFVVLGIVLLAMGFVVYPAGKWVYAKLDLRPVSLLIAGGAIIIAAGLMAYTLNIIRENERQYQETLNPPPEVVNIIKPDAISLVQGETLYAEHCIIWQSISDDFRALRNQISTIRDETLYSAVVDGWRDLPPCEGNLSETERWHIVNYFRTLAVD